ncbi:MAG: acyl-CoA dehydrogenase [Bacteroidota bacterium]
MQTTNPKTYILEEIPGVIPFLPLLYVGWADSVLSPSEVKLVSQQVDAVDWLNDAEKQQLHEWATPGKVPNPEMFQAWVELIRELSEHMDTGEKQDLSDLGLAMAAAGGRYHDVAARKALQQIEDAMGVVSYQDFRQVLGESIQPVRRKKDINPRDLNQFLEGPYFETKEKVKKLLSDKAFELKPHPVKEDFRERVLQWTKYLAQQGFGAMAYPTEYGGQDDMGNYAAVFETLGLHDGSLTVKFGVQFGLFGGSVQQLGTKKHHDQYLKAIGTLDLPGCFAMTETGHGSNVRELETTATYDPETQEFVIHSPRFESGKEYIGNALHSKIATVFAQLISKGTSYGVHAFLVPLRDEAHQTLPGIKVVDNGYKLGLNGVDNGRIWFDQVRIPRENLLDRFGSVDELGNYSSPIESDGRRFFTMLGTLVGGRVCVPRAGLSAMKNALRIAVEYALKRRQFGPDDEPESLIMNYPSHQRRLMPHLAKAYALHFALDHLLEFFVHKSEDNIRELETLAAGLKSYATWATTAAIQECREACGGKGYLFENRFADLKADTEIYTTFEGDNTVLMQLVAKGLLTEFKEEFNDLNWWGMVKFLISQVGGPFSEIAYADLLDESHLRNEEWHLRAFKYREREMLLSVSKRLRGYIGRGMSAYDAFLRVQNQLLAMAQAFIERIVLEQFIDARKRSEGQAFQGVLDSVYQLYALHTIESNAVWYLEKNYISGNKSKSIRKLVDKLCLEVRQDADVLVAGFQIPKSFSGALINQ